MSIKKQQHLKALQRRLIKAETDLQEAERERIQSSRNYDHHLKSANALKHQIKALSLVEIVVTDHALVRFMERAMDFDMEKIKERISQNLGETVIDGKYPVEENLRAVVKNNTVVTVI